MTLGRWAHLGHRLGECWSDNRLTFIHVPKNASSSVKGYLINLKFEYYDKLQETDEYFTVLRDPVDRWISGMIEYQINSGNLDMPVDQIFNTITYDDHTELQSYFLCGINHNITFLNCDQNLFQTLDKFLQSKGYESVLTPHYINVSGGTKLKLKQKLKNIVDTHPEYLLKLKEHFAKDYKLIESIKFYD